MVAMAVPAEALAMPAFARRYETSCQTCHAVAYPELNAWGRQFKENGYQYPEGAEEAYRAEATNRPHDSFLDVLREVPFAARGQVVGQVVIDNAAKDTVAVPGLFAPKRLDLVLGASAAENVSLYGTFGLAPTPTLHFFSVGLHNLFAPGAFNIRAGRFALVDFQRPGHRSLTLVSNPGQTVQVGANPFLLDDHHVGVHAWGRPGRGPFFYEAAVVQGPENPATGLDQDLWKDVWGRTSLDVGAHRAAVFGYYGNVTLQSESGGLTRKFTDPHFVAGADAEVALSRASLFGYFLVGKHQNPRGLGTAILYTSARAELDVPIGYRWLLVGRFDGVFSRDDVTLQSVTATASAGFLPVPNVRLALEGMQGFRGKQATTLSLLVDAAF